MVLKKWWERFENGIARENFSFSDFVKSASVGGAILKYGTQVLIYF